MRISSPSKAIFIILNHATATLVPRDIVGPIRLASRDGAVSSVRTWPGADMLSSFNLLPNLFSRQNNNNNNNNNNQSCQRCRKKCPTRFKKDPDNCRRCVRCPQGQKGNADSTKCINENDKDDDDKDKNKDKPSPEEKEKRYQKVKRKMGKKVNYDREKKNKKNEWDEREKKRVNNENRKKTRFMGRCITLVPLAMGGAFAQEFAGDYFDEAFLEHYTGDMLQHWPNGVTVPPWVKEEDDAIYEDEEFVDKYVEYGNAHTKRWLAERSMDENNNATYFDGEGEVGLDLVARHDQAREAAILRARANPLPYEKKPGDLVVNDDLEERLAFLIPIFMAIFSTLARVAAVVARAGSALMRVARGTVKVAKGRGSQNSYKKQADGFGKIAREGKDLWKTCLRRQTPK